MQDSPSSARVSLLRKLIHLASTLVPAMGWLVSYWLAVTLAGVAIGASLALEAARRWLPWVNRLLWRLFPSLFREWEDRRLLGSTWFSLGMLVTLLLCGRDAGGTAILFLAWGDPAAEMVGRRWGRPGQKKTVVGSLGCLAACLLASVVGIMLGGLSPLAVVLGAIAATLIERWPPPPDDNLWMPILSGLTMLLVEWLSGGTPHLFFSLL